MILTTVEMDIFITPFRMPPNSWFLVTSIKAVMNMQITDHKGSACTPGITIIDIQRNKHS